MDNNEPTLSLNVHVKLKVSSSSLFSHRDIWKFDKNNPKPAFKLNEMVLRNSNLSLRLDDQNTVVNLFASGAWIRIQAVNGSQSEPEGFVITNMHSSLSVIDDKISLLCDGLPAYTFTDLDAVYEIEVSERGDHLQRADLIQYWDKGSICNVLFIDKSHGENPKFTSFVSDFQNLQYRLISFLPHIVIKYHSVDSSWITLSREKIAQGQFVDVDHPTHAVQFKNFMHFEMSEPVVSNQSESDIDEALSNRAVQDEAISRSFDCDLLEDGIKERDRLLSYAKLVLFLKRRHAASFFAPIVNVCQSSGCGKSRIATELMRLGPSIYTVLRDPNAGKGYPSSSAYSRCLLINPASIGRRIKIDEILVYYSFLMSVFLEDYLVAIKEEYEKASEGDNPSSTQVEKNKEKLHGALKELRTQFVEGTFIGHNLSFHLENLQNYKQSLLDSSESIEDDGLFFQYVLDQAKIEITGSTFEKIYPKYVAKCKNTLKHIAEFTHGIDKTIPPFTFILDEASLLAANVPRTKVTFFRCFIHIIYLFTTSNCVLITLGTNSNIIDLNPRMSGDSFREPSQGQMFPPFILSRNWDIHFDSEDLLRNPIGYDSLQCGRLLIFLYSLGRALWSSVTFSNIPALAQIKLTNDSIKGGQAYLAMWMVRTGVSVNPFHDVCPHLVKSLMARVMLVTDDLRSLVVKYPSEPALALAAKKCLGADDSLKNPNESLENYYEAMEQFIQSRAVDHGEISERLAADVWLLGTSKSEPIEFKTWDFVEGLPKVCEKNMFILEDESSAATAEYISDRDFNGFYQVYRLDSYLKGTFGSNIFDKLIKYVPELLKSAFVNISHFVQASRDFPTDHFEGVFDADEQPVVESDPEVNNPCDFVTANNLEVGIMRGCGFSCPRNYFGLDHVIPVVLNPDEMQVGDLGMGSLNLQPAEQEAFRIRPLRPDYAYIGIQVKRSGKCGPIHEIMAKCAVSNHLVRCAKHRQCSEDCQHRIPDHSYQQIRGNGLVFIQIMKGKNAAADASNFNSSPVLHVSDARIPDIWKRMSNRNRRISAAVSEEDRKIVTDYLNELCPEAFREKLFEYRRSIQLSPISPSKYANSRFMPEIFVSLPLTASTRVCHMAKRLSDGQVERLTAIVTFGFEPFGNVLPPTVARIAGRIIEATDRTVFDEIRDKQSVKFSELIQNVLRCGNDSSFYRANNHVRHSLGLRKVPQVLPDYSKITDTNINKQL